ncbi:hypothetical protein B0H19DRAFT_1260876 [Mycena capillaripes]|nr:hypothetical protein B0H19DRAFT_1260876 [Mycena capillaripes]
MRSTFAPLLVCASFAAVAFGQLMINTPVPTPVECQPTLLSWSGGTPPYIITCAFLADANNQGNTLISFGTDITNTSLTWNTALPAGQACVLFIKDSTGQPQNSGLFTIQAGSDSCLNSASSPPASSGVVGPTGSSVASTPPVTTPSTTPTTTPATTPATTPSTKPSTTGSSTKPVSSSGSGVQSSAPPSSSTGAARATGVPAAAAAAALGAVFAALF